MADWAKFYEGKSGTTYLDPATVKYKNGKAKFTVLSDMNKAVPLPGTEKVFISMVNKYEYDCQKTQFKIVEIGIFTENMAQGETIYSGPTDNYPWKDANANGSNEYPAFGLICR